MTGSTCLQESAVLKGHAWSLKSWASLAATVVTLGPEKAMVSRSTSADPALMAPNVAALLGTYVSGIMSHSPWRAFEEVKRTRDLKKETKKDKGKSEGNQATV